MSAAEQRKAGGRTGCCECAIRTGWTLATGPSSLSRIQSFYNLVNMMDSYELYPDRYGLILRNTASGRRQLAQVRWGLPSSQKAIFENATKRADKLRAKGKEFDFNELLKMEPDGGTTNVRNTSSAHWKR